MFLELCPESGIVALTYRRVRAMAQRDMRTRFVLAVEDDGDEAALLEKAFERSGYGDRLRLVADAEEATAYILGQAPFSDRVRFPLPSLILLDLNLKGKSGVSFLQWYRSRPESRGVPVVMLTGSVEYANVKGAFEAGATSYLVKPAEFETLVQSMKTVLTYWLVMNTPI